MSDSPATLIDILRQRAAHQPQQIAYRFLPSGQPISRSISLTYGQLDQQARSIATWLHTSGFSQQRAVLVYPYEAGLEFIAAFLGCLYAGTIAVSAHPPRNRSGAEEILARCIDAEASVLLTTQAFLAKLQSQIAAQIQTHSPQPQTTYQWCATDRLSGHLSGSINSTWEPASIDPDSLAFLQYTSGSTGQPKGVQIRHANLMQNQRLLQLAFGHDSQSVGVGWLPLFHDMGLIGNVLQALYLGAPCILMSPIDFVQKPLRWLEAISHYQATTSGAPNFAYDLLCRKVTAAQQATLDLSSWQVAFTGAEPVRLETIDRFSQTFAACGFRREAFYPCYGMAEATLFITGNQKLQPPVTLCLEPETLAQHQARLVSWSSSTQPERDIAIDRTLVSCGQPWLDTEIEIVDPQTGQICPPDQIGEIWVAGSGLGNGYWNQPELTQQTFRATLPDRPDRFYLRTGDLGFLHQGNLFITGRMHDVMVFWGFNHYPQLIEQTVAACHPGLQSEGTAAFAVKIQDCDRLIIAQEVERSYRDRLKLDEIIELIRWRVFEEHFVDVYGIILLKPGGLPRTSSGKVQRSACRQKFLAQELDAIDQWQQPADLPSDPNAVMERYFHLGVHLKRYTKLTEGKIKRWMAALPLPI
jgi:acyl-CoA synthetase (AMP-forming)/AMP-acid ligase II